MVTVGVKNQPETQVKKLPTKPQLNIEEASYKQSRYEQEKILENIPRSMTESAKYFLIYVEQMGSETLTIYKRVSSISTVFSKILIDCDKNKFKRLGYSESEIGKLTDDSFDNTNSKWEGLIEGSSKADTVKYVCDRSGR